MARSPHRRTLPLRLPSGAAAAALVAGCQLVVPSDAVQCKVDTDCNARGGAFTGSVCVDSYCKPRGDRCLGRVPAVVEDPQTTLLARLRFTEFGTPVGGIEVLTCASGDELCVTPLGPPVFTDATGYLNVQLAKNFRGTLQVKNPPAGSDYMKLKVHFVRPFEVSDAPDAELAPEHWQPMLKRATLAELVSARVALVPNAGFIFGSTVDCDGQRRLGVRIAPAIHLPPTALEFYFVDGRTVSLVATETQGLGLFGLVNVPAGPVPLDVLIPSVGPQRIGRANLWINADTVSTARLGPTYVAP